MATKYNLRSNTTPGLSQLIKDAKKLSAERRAKYYKGTAEQWTPPNSGDTNIGPKSLFGTSNIEPPHQLPNDEPLRLPPAYSQKYDYGRRDEHSPHQDSDQESVVDQGSLNRNTNINTVITDAAHPAEQGGELDENMMLSATGKPHSSNLIRLDKYNGSDSIVAWLSRFDKFCKINNIDNKQKSDILPFYLEQGPLNYYNTLTQDVKDDTNELQEALLNRYKVESQYCDFGLLNIRQNPSESVDNYFGRIYKIALDKDIPERILLSLALSGLLHSIRRSVIIAQPDSMDELLRLAKLAEVTNNTESASIHLLEDSCKNIVQEIKELKCQVNKININNETVQSIKPNENAWCESPPQSRPPPPQSEFPVHQNESPYNAHQQKPPMQDFEAPYARSRHNYNNGYTYRNNDYANNYNPRNEYRNYRPVRTNNEMSNYRPPKIVKNNIVNPRPPTNRNKCSKCGNERCRMGNYCRAANVVCHNCGIVGHFSRMCLNARR